MARRTLHIAASLQQLMGKSPPVVGRAIGLLGARFALAAFFLPLAVRAIPEMIAGPYPIGYDTIAAYVPIMLDWGKGNFQSFNPIIGGWLTFAILGTAYWGTQADPVLILKVAGPILYGLLGFSEYYFARKTLGWEREKSLLLVLIASTYFVSLRISLDLFRNTLGISLLLLTLTVCKNLKTWRRLIVLGALVWLVSITHLLVAALLLAFLLVEATRSPRDRTFFVLSATPGIAQISLSLVGFHLQGIGLLAESSQSLQSLSKIAFPFYIFLPLIPIAAFGLRTLANRTIKWWLLGCAVGLAFAGAPFSTMLVFPDRWTFMMSIPMAIYATEGHSKLKSLASYGRRMPHVVGRAWVVTLLLLGAAYLVLPTGNAFPYFGFFSPPSMLQSTVPLEDSGNIVAAMNWLSSNIQPNSVLVTHNAFYGWARLYFHGNASIVGYNLDVSLQTAVQMTVEKELAQIYTIWWTDSYGSEYDQPTVPPGLVLQHQEGRIGVFLYDQ